MLELFEQVLNKFNSRIQYGYDPPGFKMGKWLSSWVPGVYIVLDHNRHLPKQSYAVPTWVDVLGPILTNLQWFNMGILAWSNMDDISSPYTFDYFGAMEYFFQAHNVHIYLCLKGPLYALHLGSI